MNEKIKYDNPAYCNRCGELNKQTIVDSINYRPCEIKTICMSKDCGFKDYWAYGFFMSREEGYCCSKKY